MKNLDYLRIQYKLLMHQFINAQELYDYITQAAEIWGWDNESCFSDLVLNGFKNWEHVPLSSKRSYLQNLLAQYQTSFPYISFAEARWIEFYILCMTVKVMDIKTSQKLDEIYNTLPDYVPRNDTLLFFKKQVYITMLNAYLTLNKPQDKIINEYNNLLKEE